jgi:transcriptional regulator with XRE-family HTH domain
MPDDTTLKPHPIDVHVGLRARGRRNELGMSQSNVGEALGISFQQVQKYERGANRVSASMLWEMAKAMDVPVAYFFEGYGDEAEPASPDSPASPSRFFQSADGFDLAQAFLQIPEGPVRKVVLTIARQLANLPVTH